MSRIADVLRKVHESGDGQTSGLGGPDPLGLKRPQDIAVPWRLATDTSAAQGRLHAVPDTASDGDSVVATSVELDLRAVPSVPHSWPAASSRIPTRSVPLEFDHEITALVYTLFGNGSAVSAQSAPRRIVFAYLPGAPVPAPLVVQISSRLAASRHNRTVGLIDLDCSGQDAVSIELRVEPGPGFTDIALDQAPVESVAHPIPPMRNLRFVGPGSRARESKAQILASKPSQAGHRTVNAFDYVVAIAPTADLRHAPSLLECFDGVALVVDPRLTTVESVKTIASQFTRAGIRVLGAILDTHGGSPIKYVPAPFR